VETPLERLGCRPGVRVFGSFRAYGQVPGLSSVKCEPPLLKHVLVAQHSRVTGLLLEFAVHVLFAHVSLARQ
jgi:hypothetical protein